MRKAVAKNPNMIRTLLGLSLTLIILLSYAVYGATQNPDYYLYSTESTTTHPALTPIGEHPRVSGEGSDQKTLWIWEFTSDPANLTWVNLSTSAAPAEGRLNLLNPGGSFWSHPNLGDAVTSDFNCADSTTQGGGVIWTAVDCQYGASHSTDLDEGEATLIALTHPDPARRDGGTVHARSTQSAWEKAAAEVEQTHPASMWQVSLELEGNHSGFTPQIELSFVNEELSTLDQFSLDAATEMLWAFASLAGCFLLLLVPAFTIYIASQYKSRREGEEVALTLSEDEE